MRTDTQSPQLLIGTKINREYVNVKYSRYSRKSLTDNKRRPGVSENEKVRCYSHSRREFRCKITNILYFSNIKELKEGFKKRKTNGSDITLIYLSVFFTPYFFYR